MDDIFKKSSNVFDCVTISIKQPYRYDKHGQLKAEYVEEFGQYENSSELKQTEEHFETSS